jgi:hypothetical protein
VNDVLVQDAPLLEMTITPQMQIEDLIKWAPVQAGDLLFTGTPSGVGQLHAGRPSTSRLEKTRVNGCFRDFGKVCLRVAFIYALFVALFRKVVSLWHNGTVSLDENPVADAKFRHAASALRKFLPRSKWHLLAHLSARFTAAPVATPSSV